MGAFISHHNNRKLPTRKASVFYTEGWVIGLSWVASYLCLFYLPSDKKYKMVQKCNSSFNGELIICWWSAPVLRFTHHIFALIWWNNKIEAAWLSDELSNFPAMVCLMLHCHIDQSFWTNCLWYYYSVQLFVFACVDWTEVEIHYSRFTMFIWLNFWPII